MKKLILALALTWPVSPATARVWGSPGGWTVLDGTESCFMEREFEGEGATTLGISVDASRIVLYLTNYNWTVAESDRFRVSIEIDRHRFAGPSAGFRSGIRRGFVGAINDEILSAIAAGSGIAFYREESGTLIDNLRLDSSRAAVNLLRQCAASLRARLTREQRDRDRLSHIPRDPFATAPPRPSAVPAMDAVRPARSNLGPLSAYFSSDDYPAAALRAAEQGRTSIRMVIGPNGRVTGCTITASSGSESLDQATCRIARSRARFTPARDPQGNPMSSQMDSSITWTLPSD